MTSRRAGRPGPSLSIERVIRRVGVVGLGTMGAGIAQVSAQAGFETIGREVSDEICQRARERIEHYVGRAVEKGCPTWPTATW